MSQHIKEPQNSIYCLNSYKMTKFETLFHAKSNLLCLCERSIVLLQNKTVFLGLELNGDFCV